MICVACRVEHDAPAPAPALCPTCGGAPRLAGRYLLTRLVGRGALGSVFEAEDPDGGRVAIKEIPLVRTEDEKLAALCRREARVLRQLDHPAIPSLREDLLAGGRLYLVQEFVAGRTLAEEMSTRRYDPDEVTAILRDLAGVLAYLHGLSPPVIHRDVKPGNVIRRTNGGLSLVDFGAVRDVLRDPGLGGSTVAGTFGYMAPEQFRGDASPATDVYGLGALAVALLSRREPATLMGYDHRFRWRDAVQVPPKLGDLLTRMLAPDPADRLPDARAVLGALDRLRTGDRAVAPRRPALWPPALGIAAAGLIAVGAGLRLFEQHTARVLMEESLASLVITASPPPAIPSPEPTPAPAEEPAPAPPAEVIEDAPPPVQPIRTLDDPTHPIDHDAFAVVVDPATRSLIPALEEGAVLWYVHATLDGLRSAQAGHEAARDRFAEDLSALRWAPDHVSKWYLAFRLEADQPWPLRALVTRGPARGRLFAAELEGDKVELPPLDEDGVLAFLAAPDTIGNADPWLPAVVAPNADSATTIDDQIVPRLDEDALVLAAYEALLSLRKHQVGYDAAFDEFTDDLRRLGWAPEPPGRSYMAVAVTSVGRHQANLRAVLTRGPGRGRVFESNLSGVVTEGERLDEAGVQVFLAQEQWAGDAGE